MRIIVYFVYCFPLSPQRLSDCGCFFGVLCTRLRGCSATRLHIIYFCCSPPLMNKFMRCLSPNFLRRDGDFCVIPTVCHGHPLQEFCRSPPLMNKFMRCLSPNFLRRDGDFCVIPTVCHGHPLQEFCRSPPLMNKFMRCLSPNFLRRDGDSNPGNPFGVYTLSRRASSTTRASLLNNTPPNSAAAAFLCTHSRLFCTGIFYRLRIGTMQKRCKVTKNIQYHKSRGLFFVFFHYRTPKVHFCGQFIAGEKWKIKE